MTDTPFAAPTPTLLPIHQSDARFPVRRIYCVGRNYAEHAREMGHDPNREPPFFFTKPGDAATVSGRSLPFPPQTQNLHHEAELVVAIGGCGTDISPAEAEGLIWGYGAGNDLTRRDIQAKAKEMRRPWDMAKGFDHSAIIGALHAKDSLGDMTHGAIRATVNGDIRQSADLSEMIWPVDAVVAYLSRLVTLQPGDLVMTGTPAGVGQIKPGDTCAVEIEGLSPAVVSFR
ncbi:fumarylacetoacetate hydrolase family protein [Cognatishimia sp. WU-CL00825]|uniref:fumarylacetoacetate hydrolase family protein n=1 Tax=Cognatishimia sp. WU-CL00825 TaxID=3127658 RepID=UPI00310A2AF1